ncbi:MAG: D-amino acid dehydrogenase 1 [Paracidovorax wautersii]|uniref:D-amino acid dehydrogenase 1 n=1 Tax=Paracidovorax wautersii TaxID=1177982 RepID=A0A7V8FNP3_9BURK|nr:MAG: D-amino acid dehydrogenase 1 [Paracidovorax wautersii]
MTTPTPAPSDIDIDVLVIGAGIIGAMAACYLQRAGRSVVLLEREAVAAGASAGNAGILAFPEITPMAAPDLLRKVPRWLADPLGPLAIRPAYALRIAPWLWRFWRASQPQAQARALAAQTALMHLAQAEMAALMALPTLAPHFRQTGTLDLYDSAASLQAAQPAWAARARAGFAFERIGRADIERLQPGLAPRFAHGYFSPAGTQIQEPRRFAEAIAELARHHGAQVRHGTATHLAADAQGATVTLADGQRLRARAVVVACGAWSRPLAASLGDAVPLDTERGYNTTLPLQAFELQRQLYFNDHAFVVTPLATGIRVGGAVELGGLTLPPNPARAQALLAKAGQFLPGLDTRGGQSWMGFRPSLPDSLPVIGHASRSRHVVYAFGHGHLGLTQSAGTARLVAELVGGQPPSIVLDAFSATRFARH